MLRQVMAGVAMLLLSGLASAEPADPVPVQLIEQDSGVDVRLRGLSAVDAQVAWASGGEGTVLRTVDGGGHWQRIPVPGAAGLDFRDIEAFDAEHAVLLSIGPGGASRVYSTANGGQDWALVLQNRDPAAFLDCLAFDGAHGVILGDPVAGRFQIYETRDRGGSWTLREDGPAAAAGEAAFAASGTCIALKGDQLVIVTGGAQARAHLLSDGADGSDRVGWLATDPADQLASASTGYFSVAATPRGFIAVGGDYERPSTPGMLATLMPAPVAGSGSPSLEARAAPPGYRSGIACPTATEGCLATGPSGTDWWDGTRWTPVSPLGFDAVDVVGSSGWASGENGRIARIEILPAVGTSVPAPGTDLTD